MLHILTFFQLFSDTLLYLISTFLLYVNLLYFNCSVVHLFTLFQLFNVTLIYFILTFRWYTYLLYLFQPFRDTLIYFISTFQWYTFLLCFNFSFIDFISIFQWKNYLIYFYFSVIHNYYLYFRVVTVCGCVPRRDVGGSGLFYRNHFHPRTQQRPSTLFYESSWWGNIAGEFLLFFSFCYL